MAAPGTEPTLVGLGTKADLRANAVATGKPSAADGPATAGKPAKTGRPPGPRGLPFVGTSFMASRDPMGRLARWAQKYGDVVYYHFFDFQVYVLFHPQDVEKVLLGKTEAFVKGMTSRANPDLFGNGLLTSDGEFWRRQRRLSNPAFHRESIVRYAEITTEEAGRLLDRWKSRETRNIWAKGWGSSSRRWTRSCGPPQAFTPSRGIWECRHGRGRAIFARWRR